MSSEEETEFEDKPKEKGNDTSGSDSRRENFVVDSTLEYETFKNILILNGYQFTNSRTVIAKGGTKKSYWRCIVSKKFRCKGTLATIDVDGQYQILKDSPTKHSHPPDYLAIEKRKFVGLVKKYYYENTHLSVDEIYDHFLPSMSPQIAQIYPSASSIRHICRKRYPNETNGNGSFDGDAQSLKKSRNEASRIYDPTSFPSTLSDDVPHMIYLNANSSALTFDSSRIEETHIPHANTSSGSHHTNDSNCLEINLNTSYNSTSHNFEPGNKSGPPKTPHPINLNKYNLTLPMNGHLNVTDWGIDHVSYFLTYNGFPTLVSTFEENHVNGLALVELDKSDLVLLMKIKVGYALQLFRLIKQLRSIFSYKECFN